MEPEDEQMTSIDNDLTENLQENDICYDDYPEYDIGVEYDA